MKGKFHSKLLESFMFDILVSQTDPSTKPSQSRRSNETEQNAAAKIK